MWAYISMTLLMLSGLFMMFIILLQRGRGGGLAGAFGGAGGQSAFGTKAGDVFTKVTVAVAVLWVVLAGVSGFALRDGAEDSRFPEGAGVQEGASMSPIGGEGDDALTDDDALIDERDEVFGEGLFDEGAGDAEEGAADGATDSSEADPVEDVE